MKTEERLEVLGLGFDPVTRGEALDALNSFLDAPDFHLVVTLGTEMVMHGQNDREFVDVSNGAALVVPDGIGLVLAGRWCGFPVPQKVAGVEIVQSMAQSFGPRLRVFCLGAAPGVAEEAASALRAMAPGLQIAGVRDGYFKDDEEVVRQVADSNANVLLVALGFPRQEKWLAKYGPRTGVKIGIGVGGTFDVLSGRIKRAPSWMISLGLEWLYRLSKQPSRWRRMLVLPSFALKVIRRGRKAVHAFASGPTVALREAATVSSGENPT